MDSQTRPSARMTDVGNSPPFYGSTNNIPASRGVGLQFFDFSVLCRWISRKNTQLLMDFNFRVAGLTRSSPRICTTAQFRGARPWLDFGGANLLDFFLFQKSNAPWTRISHVSFYPHKDQQKNQSPPKNSVSIPSCAFTLRFHGFHGWWSFMGKKTIPLFGASTFVASVGCGVE